MCFVDNCPPEQTHSIADVLTSGLQCFTFAEIKNLGQLNLIVVYYVCVCVSVCVHSCCSALRVTAHAVFRGSWLLAGYVIFT